MREDRAISTSKGTRFEFEPTLACFIPVNMLYHNLNKGVPIVEVAPAFSRRYWRTRIQPCPSE
jgi:hypothetical protein